VTQLEDTLRVHTLARHAKTGLLGGYSGRAAVRVGCRESR
jgi:hypothetical protein